MRKYICEGLADYLAKELKPWHMPGHKRKNYIEVTGIEAVDAGVADIHCNRYIEQVLLPAYIMDVTEVSGTDDLHHPEEMILRAQQELAKVYGTEASYYMVNGSTGGILAAIGAVATLRDPEPANQGKDTTRKLVIARNCHRSVYNGMELFNLEPIYVEPECVEINTATHNPGTCSENSDYAGGENSDYAGVHMGKGSDLRTHIYGDIKPQQIRDIIKENPHVAAVVITSPTYEGIVSDVAGIKKVLEPYNIPLIVDEAHGAHLPFIDKLPESAINCGGDIVIQSLHKTLPALTQTAILHVNNPQLDEGVRRYLSVFMSSSPSYPMLCSMEGAVALADERARSKEGFDEYISNLKEFRDRCNKLSNLYLLRIQEEVDGSHVEEAYEEEGCYAQDISRIVICADNKDVLISGQQLQEALRKYGHIEVEMSGVDYVVLISTFVDSRADFDELYKALQVVDNRISMGKLGVNPVPRTDIEGLGKLVGTKAEDNLYVYPPGSYIVAAGEVITEEAINTLVQLAGSGKKIYGIPQGVKI